MTITEPAHRRTDADRAATARVLNQVNLERIGQDTVWGEQNHPDHAPIDPGFVDDVGEYELRARRLKELNAMRERQGLTAWDSVLLEEVYEALAEQDPVKRRVELVQVAAVAVAWIESGDRRAVATTTATEDGGPR